MISQEMLEVAAELEKNYLQIKKEFISTSNEGTSMFPHLHDGGWKLIGLRHRGKDVKEGHDSHPTLSRIILKFNDLVESCGFSILKANTVINPHIGYSKIPIMRCHLALQIPEGDVALKVECEIIKWQEGKTFIFDDATMHEAWNKTEYKRVVVIIDFKINK